MTNHRILHLIIPSLMALLTAVQAQAQTAAEQRADSITVTRLLQEGSRQKSSACLPLFFARQLLGRPYVAHTLEGNDPERLVVNTRQLDCTTLVENVVALTLCTQRRSLTYHAFRQALTAMRYRGGVIKGYASRIHYFTEWITENTRAGIVTEIQSPDPPFTAVQQVSVNYMSRHPQSYEALRNHPELVADISRMEKRVSGQRFRFIPKARVGRSSELRKAVRDGDIIAITCKKAGLDIAHLGFAVWGSDGNLHLLNASMLHKKVVEEPMTLYQYLQRHPSHTGIRIIRINK